MSDKEGPKLAERPEKEGRKIAEPPKAMQKDTTTGEGANIFKELRDKSEDDSNSYSKINKTFISKLRATKETLEDKSSPMKGQRLFDRMLSKKKEDYEKKKY